MENKHTRKELKEYLLLNDFDLRNYKIRDIEDYPSGLELQDDKGRRISSCWKDQKKYKKQWMHKIKANNANSIRYYEEV